MKCSFTNMINLVSRGNIPDAASTAFWHWQICWPHYQKSVLASSVSWVLPQSTIHLLCCLDRFVGLMIVLHLVVPLSQIVMVFAMVFAMSAPHLCFAIFCHPISAYFSAFHGCPASVLQQLFDLLQNSHAALSSQRSKHQPHLRENRCIMGPLNWSIVGPITMIRL